MIFIKHRQNTGITPKSDPVEVDVYAVGNVLWMGHDKPEQPLPSWFIENDKVWYHAKDFKAYKKLLELDVKCFMHKDEPFAKVNKGFLWTTIPEQVTKKTVFMDVHKTTYLPFQISLILEAYGICSDNLKVWRSIYGNR